jgi:hypothetical protein
MHQSLLPSNTAQTSWSFAFTVVICRCTRRKRNRIPKQNTAKAM